MIGRLEHTLKQRRIEFAAVTRNEVKLYVFNHFQQVAIPYIEKAIARKENKVTKAGKPYRPSFIYVNDRIVRSAMQVQWNLESRPGQKNKLGIKTHAWQALGAFSAYMSKLDERGISI